MTHAALVAWSAVSCVLAAFALAPTAYLAFLALLAGPRRPRVTSARTLRFAFLVPAHNEESGIASTVASLLAVDWPKDRVDVVVVADNCDDRTAEVAASAGARVLVRQDRSLRGKGYALAHGFEHLLGTNADAVVVIDADTIVSSNLLAAFASRIEEGALAMQAEYGVRNVHASWRTELMAVALAMFHTLRSNARERLSLSAGLRGNGMCFTRECLTRFPQRAFGLVEDVEQGIALGRAGVRVVAVVDAHVLGEMVSSAQASESQRRRWEEGRAKLTRDVGPRLWREALSSRSVLLFDLAMDLLVPPLSTVALLVAFGLVVEGARVIVRVSSGVGGIDTVSIVAMLPTAGLLLYVGRGMQLSGLGWRSLVVVARAPAYVAWKIGLKLRGRAKDDVWVRTSREEKPGADSSLPPSTSS
jgi:1,2-diacylglycerol 3-beta-glucosyltransferase